MEFISRYAALLLALSATASCLRRVVPLSPAAGETIGAAYFMSNEPSGNYIFASGIATNGSLTLRKAYYTGGTGVHGFADGPDPLFSESGIAASKVNNMLLTVNPGSGSLSAFRIDPREPTELELLGKPVSSSGDFPVSVTMNRAGDMACVLNGGKVNGISCFTVNSRKGLIPRPNTLRSLGLNQTTPATGPFATAGHITFSEDETRLMVSVKGVPPIPGLVATPGFLAIWDVAQDGTLSEQFSSIVGGILPWSVTNIPGKNAVISADAALGFDIFPLDRCDKVKQIPIPTQLANCWTGYSKNTGNFYLSDLLTAHITEVHIDENLNATIVRRYDTDEYDGTIEFDIASVGGTDHLYVLAANVTSIEVFALNGPGNATRIQKLHAGDVAHRAGLQLRGDFVSGLTTWVKTL
ncbi:hypothetical protein AX17_002346 [Amanita inopinata Kibby_2008]|nr:hypothetical protein AX17_002346 [Amanita inopinata Kibby_2008]